MGIHVLDAMSREGFEEVIGLHDRESGLKAFIAIHDTTVGPAFGGVRRWSYFSERAALMDVLRLSRAMTRKCVMAGVPGGGGKAVILDEPGLDLERTYRFMGARVESMGGRFYTGPDVGTDGAALDWLSAETAFVTRTGDAGPGDLAAATAAGAFAGIRAGLEFLDGDAKWTERRIVVQGLGGVGERLARRLVEVGASVAATDIDVERGRRVADAVGAEFVEPSTEVALACDVFAPCALGGILHDVTIERLRARLIAGAANNILAKTHHADMLADRGVLLLPDFVTNAGALIRGALWHLEGRQVPLSEVETRVAASTVEVLQAAASEARPPARVARDLADERIAARRC
jgi:leucine dehydrogenase